MSTDLLIFNLGEEPYALPVRQATEVVPRARLSPLPGAPTGLLGMLRLRGALVPVVDLRTRLRLPTAFPHIGQRIVVTRTATTVVGLLVDRVDGVAPAGERVFRPDAPPSTDRLVWYVEDTHERLVTVLDAEAVVGSKIRAYVATLGGPARSQSGGRSQR